MSDKQCARRVFDGGYFGYPCTRKGTKQEDGKWWCWQHAPSAEEERAQQRDEKFKKDWIAREVAAAKRKAREEIVTVAIAYFDRCATHDALEAAVAEYRKLEQS